MAHFLAGKARPQVLSLALVAGTLAAAGATAADLPQPWEKDGRIGYVVTDRNWAVYESEDPSVECPQGVNESGPREQFEMLLPAKSGVERTVLETRLMREGRQWHPTTSEESFPFFEAQGDIAYGLNLDDRVDDNDFRTPDGEEGIDNQLQRVIGCTPGWRAGGQWRHFENLFSLSNG